MSDQIATVEIYRGVGIHDCQPRDRIETVVKPAIDAVFVMTDLDALHQYCRDITKPPEARLFAAAKIEASFEMAAADRVTRPAVDLRLVHAAVAALDSRGWRSPYVYGSLLDTPPAPGCPGPALRPPEYADQVEADRERRHEEERVERLQPQHQLAGVDR